MTRIEKQVVLNALVSYAANLDSDITDMIEHGETIGLSKKIMERNVAKAVGSYWQSILDKMPGSVTI